MRCRSFVRSLAIGSLLHKCKAGPNDVGTLDLYDPLPVEHTVISSDGRYTFGLLRSPTIQLGVGDEFTRLIVWTLPTVYPDTASMNLEPDRLVIFDDTINVTSATPYSWTGPLVEKLEMGANGLVYLYDSFGTAVYTLGADGATQIAFPTPAPTATFSPSTGVPSLAPTTTLAPSSALTSTVAPASTAKDASQSQCGAVLGTACPAGNCCAANNMCGNTNDFCSKGTCQPLYTPGPLCQTDEQLSVWEQSGLAIVVGIASTIGATAIVWAIIAIHRRHTGAAAHARNRGESQPLHAAIHSVV